MSRGKCASYFRSQYAYFRSPYAYIRSLEFNSALIIFWLSIWYSRKNDTNCNCLRSHVCIFTILLMFCAGFGLNLLIGWKFHSRSSTMLHVKSILVFSVLGWRIILTCRKMYFMYHKLRYLEMWRLLHLCVPTNRNHHHHPRAKPSCYYNPFEQCNKK